MLDKLFNSIVFRIGSMMFAISFVAIVSMFSSVFISEMADKDALAINHAGSLRMQSYKIYSQLSLLSQLDAEAQAKQQLQLNQSIDEFNNKVSNPLINSNTRVLPLVATEEALSHVRQRWFDEISPELLLLVDNPERITTQELMVLGATVELFVTRLDNLVALYQHRAESRILLIRMILGISLFVTVLLAAITMVQISRRVEKPLSELTRTAKQLMAGDYSARTNIDQQDELGFLAETMNKMSEAISMSHQHMENRVQTKTTKLQRSNGALELLYQTSQLMNNDEGNLDLVPIAEKLSIISEIEDIDLCLTTATGAAPYEHIMTSKKAIAEICEKGDCGGCLSNQKELLTTSIDKMVMRYPIKKDEVSYGVLVCNLPANVPLEAWQNQLFTSISALVANGLHTRQQQEQTRRIALLNERTVIARELHDSLAQALSYLKMQVAMLQKLRAKQDSEKKIDSVVDELKLGLNSAYRQLRELLTTFRLKIDEAGLQLAFIQMTEQLNKRADQRMQFSLDYQIQNIPLTPNEEIHLMQIAREASQNALNHSHAAQVKIQVLEDENRHICLHIDDDGVGIPDNAEKLNHYGMAIIQERTQSLSGRLQIDTATDKGTKVVVSFAPKYLESNPQELIFSQAQ
ncbi:HAMP domain-containing protein [Thalassotalea litorea]|uniref:Sensor protein n=1 Tax=Thalassotalea litorea TaxID=2020715 RepID=A0A5R9IP87_9GAMM|nr:histidine kinase [Thalassotalea litorea]TLU66409.1 HAMP domain-containing protein [Thalassotalea litorea]